ncbi:zinc metalloproteinase nas-14-like [Ixodes scapularis]
MDQVTADLPTVNIHRGPFRVTRLQFGVATAVAIFQRYMGEHLAGFEGVLVFLDDIVIGGQNDEEHESRLRAVLKRIKDDGLRLNKDKCSFGGPQVSFQGYKIDKEGIHPTEDKIQAIQTAPEPQDKQLSQSFLGLLNIYGRLLKGLLTSGNPYVVCWTKVHRGSGKRKCGRCASFVGMQGEEQALALDLYRCPNVGQSVHELMHAIGFFHEHSRPDRDSYVSIQWNNIEEDAKQSFELKTELIADTLGQPYDYESVMHYPQDAFSKSPPTPTLIPKSPDIDPATLGKGYLENFLTDTDVIKVNLLYGCAK